MAFLDNSGDIILDAVLTEDGRRLMAQGNFQIVKFALGDDEINYGLYDTGHPSGSAYYDLEILQTPILEASTAINAGINYGLLSITNPNLLYMPGFKKNQKLSQAIALKNKVYYLAYNDGTTYDALVSAFGGTKGGGIQQVLQAGSRGNQSAGLGIVLETGLDTEELTATSNNKQQFIASNGLSDSAFEVSVDARFINQIYGPGPNDRFGNEAGSGEEKVKFALRPTAPNKQDKNRKHYRKGKIKAVANNVLKRNNDTKADTTISVMKGPRSAATALNFGLRVLNDKDFKRYGKQGVSISGASGTYSQIDTTVYVESQTGVVEQLPIRIVKKE